MGLKVSTYFKREIKSGIIRDPVFIPFRIIDKKYVILVIAGNGISNRSAGTPGIIRGNAETTGE